MCTPSIIRAEDNKSLCDGLGCNDAATVIIREEICDTGMIILHLCDECAIKFSER